MTASADMIIALLIQNLIFCAIAVFCWRRQGVTLAQVGLKRPTARELWLGLRWGFGMFLLTLLIGALLTAVFLAVLPHRAYAELQHLHETQSAVGTFHHLGKSQALMLAFSVLGSTAVPFGEELLFRGLIYRALRAKWGVKAGVILSALLFAVAHISPLDVSIIVFIGLMLAVAYQRTGSLWVTVIMHGTYNALFFVVLWQS